MIGIENLFSTIFTRLYILSIFCCIFYFYPLYILYLFVNDDKKEKSFDFFKKILFGYILINVIIMIFLPILKFYDGTKMYAYGTVVEFLRVQLGLYLIFWNCYIVIKY